MIDLTEGRYYITHNNLGKVRTIDWRKMAGLNFVFDLRNDLTKQIDRHLEALNAINHTEESKSSILQQGQSYILSCTRYPQYPITCIDRGRFYFCLEGRIYGKDPATLRAEFNDMAKAIFGEKNNAQDFIAAWLGKTDGEFLLFIKDTISQKICIINDILARLPFFYYRTDTSLILSRDFRVVVNLTEEKRFDKMALAQYLLFSHSVGGRTFIKNIYQLPPASLITIDEFRPSISLAKIHEFNFDIKSAAGRSLKDNVCDLTEQFAQACKNRTEADKLNVLSLSGGLDSRAVGAGFQYAKIPFAAVSFLDYAGTAKRDVRMAEKLSKTFNVDWSLIETGPVTGAKILRLLRLKSGFASLSVSFYLEYYEKIKQLFGTDICYFSGDGGDRVLPDVRPKEKVLQLDDLIRYIVTSKTSFPLEAAAKLSYTTRQEIIEELGDVLSRFPENDLGRKYVHFLILERSAGRFFHGEDRNRNFFWSTVPFFAMPFFNGVMNCPDEQKTHLQLYRKFLTALSPVAASVPYANIGISINSVKYPMRRWMNRVRRRKTPIGKIRRFFREPSPQPKPIWKHSTALIDCIEAQIRNCPIITDYLSPPQVKEICQTNQNYRNDALLRLLTITSLIEDITSQRSTLHDFNDNDFGFCDY